MSINPTRALNRAINIAQLNVPTYEEVEADTSSTTEAGAVLLASGVIGALGTLFTNGLWAFLVWIAATIVGWFVWAWSSATIAERVFNVTTTDTGEMLRVIGYGSAPRVLGFIPFVGFFVTLWTMACVITGIRQAADSITLVGAIITAFVGMVPTLIAYGIVLAIF